jgi:hypothetical protein
LLGGHGSTLWRTAADLRVEQANLDDAFIALTGRLTNTARPAKELS